MRIHDGISGAFAFAEQLCGLENLRLFTDPSTGTSIGMIHYTPAFNSGYMKFPLNNVFELIRVREESDTVIRIKGLKIPVVKSVGKNKSDNPVRITHTASRQEQDGTTSVKAKPDKIITGAKIEFYTPLDKTLFMAKLKEIQDSYHP